MTKIPEEFQEVLNNKELQETVAKQPGTKRFKAMVLGLSTLQYVKSQANGEESVKSKE